jgi:hypothetical protein
MKEFNPPIEERDTDELVIIASSSTNDWQQDAIDIATQELRRRRVSLNQQQERYKYILTEEARVHKEEMDRRAVEDFHPIEMILMVVVWPKTMLKNWSLRKEGYILKAKRRLTFIGIGITLTACMVIYSSLTADDRQQKIIEEIEKVDVSDWIEKKYTEEENRAMDDSIQTAIDKIK